MKAIWPEGWSTAGHYSPGMISGGMLYISGQLPVNHETGKIEGDIHQQAKTALENMNAVLLAAGTDRKHVVQCRVYVPDVGYWDAVNAVYAGFFGDHKPARAVVPSRNLHHGALVEIEAIAELEG